MNKFLTKAGLAIFVFTFTSCSPYHFFYYPNKKLYLDPVKIGMPYDLVSYPSLNGKILYAIIFKTEKPVKGTVVHFHGNFGNVSNHFLESQFLVNYGFDVLVFDYEGYGGSAGKPTPPRTIEDGIATVKYARDHLRNPAGGVGVFGQSIGAAIAAVVAAKDPEVKGAVLESGFNSYRAIARVALKRSVFTWILYPIYPLFIGTRYDPERFIGEISPRPVFILHGDEDRIIPSWMSERLFQAAREPKKLWLINEAGHLELRRKESKKYEEALADFFTSAFHYPKSNN